jgi:hypothetical protein
VAQARRRRQGSCRDRRRAPRSRRRRYDLVEHVGAYHRRLRVPLVLPVPIDLPARAGGLVSVRVAPAQDRVVRAAGSRSRRPGFDASAGPASRTRSLAPRVCSDATGFTPVDSGRRGTIPAALCRPKHRGSVRSEQGRVRRIRVDTAVHSSPPRSRRHRRRAPGARPCACCAGRHAAFLPGIRTPTVADRNHGLQAVTSNGNVSDLFACRWLRAPATSYDSRLGEGGNDPRVLTRGAVI